MISDNETNFSHKLLLTNRQVPNSCKAFANHLSTDIRLSKTQLSKMVQSGGVVGRLLGPLLKTRFPLIKNVIKPLAKSVLIPLGLTAAASAAYAGIHKKIFGSGNMTTLMNESNSIECNSIEAINKTNLSEKTKFCLSEIIGIENYFHQEINQIKPYSKKLSKYITVFDYIDKILIVLSAIRFTLFFSLTTGIVKKSLNITRKKKKKHDKILMLAKSKLNSIETLISQALTDMEISHEEFITILKEKR